MQRTIVHLVIALALVSGLATACGQAAPAPTSAPASPTKAAASAVPTTAAASAPTKAAASSPTVATAPATAAPTKGATWPQQGRTITAVIPYAAGGATDISARIVLPLVEKELGTSIQISNKPGGGSQVGNTEVALAKPDGYTIGYSAIPTIITSYLDPERKAAYTRASFAPIARPTADSILLAVQANSPYKGMKDFVDAAKANPGGLKIAVSGIMSVNELPVYMLENQAGVKFAHVNFDGSAPGVTALLGGHVDAAAALVSEVQAQVKAGTLRVLGLFDSEETEFLPGVKTAESQGYKIYMLSSHTVMAPAGTPKEAIDAISGAIKKVVSSDEAKAKLAAAGQRPRYLDAAGLAAYWEQTEKDIKPLMEMAAQQSKK